MIRIEVERMKTKTTIFLLTALLLLVSCQHQTIQDVILKENYDSSDIKELVEILSVNDVNDYEAVITSTQLIITTKDHRDMIYLPDDEFFVSVAPYIHETHPCTNHVLTSCQGELVNEDFEVTIVDEQGDIVVHGTFNSGSNGFIDLWLPRNKAFQIEIKHEEKQVISEISTFEHDGTCLTTMQLT